MAFTNQTANYGLPQWIATDKPTYLTDMNGAYEAIDRTMKANADAAATANQNAESAVTSAQQAVSDVSTATTIANEAKTAADNAGTKADNALNAAQSATTTANNANTNATQAKTEAAAAEAMSQIAEDNALEAKTMATNNVGTFNFEGAWVAHEGYWSYVVAVGVGENVVYDVTPTLEQSIALQNARVSMIFENDAGTVTAYAFADPTGITAVNYTTRKVVV